MKKRWETSFNSFCNEKGRTTANRWLFTGGHSAFRFTLTFWLTCENTLLLFVLENQSTAAASFAASRPTAEFKVSRVWWPRGVWVCRAFLSGPVHPGMWWLILLTLDTLMLRGGGVSAVPPGTKKKERTNPAFLIFPSSFLETYQNITMTQLGRKKQTLSCPQSTTDLSKKINAKHVIPAPTKSSTNIYIYKYIYMDIKHSDHWNIGNVKCTWYLSKHTNAQP